MKNLFLLIILISFASCAKNLTVSLGDGNGRITMKPTKPTPKTYVTINDKLIVDNKNVKSVTITGLEDGDKKIVYKSESSVYKNPLEVEKVMTVKNGSDKTEIITVPPYSSAYWIFIFASPAISLITLLAL